MKEIWKDIPGYEGLYQISSIGNVRSLDRSDVLGRPIKGIIMKPAKHSQGYEKIDLNKNGKNRNFYIHRLVALAFIDNPDLKPQVNHKNGIKSDNTIENLEWVTHMENHIHSVKTGLRNLSGENHPMAKLNEDDVKNIKYLLNKGLMSSQIVKDFYPNIGRSAIDQIKSGRNWPFVNANESFL